MNLPTPGAVDEARSVIGEIALRTRLVPAPSLSRDGREVRLKMETAQPTGAFKVRGAANAMLRLSGDQKARGVVCASTGNHGRAVSHVARRLGIRAVVCMSALVPENKVDAIRGLGAEVRIVGRSQDDAQREVDRLVREEGMVAVPPFDHADVVAGQGTIGLEVLEDWPDVDTVIVPLSGGGLIGGTALAIKSVAPHVRVIGVSMERGAAMHASLQAGRPVEVEERPSLADSLGGGIGLDNRITFDLVRTHVDEIVLLPEAAIAAGMRHLFDHHGLVSEGAGAVGVGALVAGMPAGYGRRIAVVVSGGNVDMAQFRRVLAGQLPLGGRKFETADG